MSIKLHPCRQVYYVHIDIDPDRVAGSNLWVIRNAGRITREYMFPRSYLWFLLVYIIVLTYATGQRQQQA